MAQRSGDELNELESRQEPRLVKALEMVAPGTALREGIVRPAPDGKTVAVLSGGNIEFDDLRKLLADG